jgi:transposase
LAVAQLDGPSRGAAARRSSRRPRRRANPHPEPKPPASERDGAGAGDRATDAQAPALHRARRRLPLASIDGLIAAIARELLERPRELNRRIDELEPLVAAWAPALLAIPGCGALTAAKLVGETAGIGRFRSKSAYARWNGTAPQPASSGTTNRFRLNRGGNRQVNAALHGIAITQARTSPQGRDFIAKRIRQGNSRTEALRVLRRRLSDVVYRTLRLDEHATTPTSSPTPATT